jgi:hypothetical protein
VVLKLILGNVLLSRPRSVYVHPWTLANCAIRGATGRPTSTIDAERLNNLVVRNSSFVTRMNALSRSHS